MPQYTRAQLLEAARADHPEFRKIGDNELFAAIAQDHPDLAKGISELNQPAYQSPKYGPEGATAPQVASDQAAEVLKGIPEAVTGIPGAMKAIGSTAWSALRGRRAETATKVGEMASAVAAPFKTVGQGAAELVAPGTTNAPAPESEEWKSAARAGGAMLAGAELPNALAGVSKVVKPAASALVNRLRGAARTSNTPELNAWMQVNPNEMMHGQNPGQRLTAENLVGATKEATRANVKTALNDAGTAMQQKLAQAGQNGVTINAEPHVMSALQDAAKTIGKRSDVTFQNRLSGILDDILEDFPDLTKLTPEQAHALKVELGKGSRWTGVAAADDINMVLKDIYGRINKELKTALPDLAADMERWGDLKTASGALKKSIVNDAAGRGTGANVPLSPAARRLKTAAKVTGAAAATGAVGATAYNAVK